MKPGIGAPGCDEIGVAPGFPSAGDSAVFHDDDQIPRRGMVDRRWAIFTPSLGGAALLSRASASCTSCSPFWVSRGRGAEVASSRSRIGAILQEGAGERQALALASPERREPPGPTRVS